MARERKPAGKSSPNSKPLSKPLSKDEMAAKKKMLIVAGKKTAAAATLRADDIETSRTPVRISSSGLLTGRGRGLGIIFADMDPRDSIRIVDTDPVDRQVRIDFDPTDPIPEPGPPHPQ